MGNLSQQQFPGMPEPEKDEGYGHPMYRYLGKGSYAHGDSGYEIKDGRENLQRQVAQGRPAIRFPSGLAREIAQSGQFKNQFDTNTSQGTLNPEYRRITENQMFAIPHHAPGRDRPVYGYVDSAGDPNGIHVRTYGDAKAVLKPSVTWRTTVTHGDSLGARYSPVPFEKAATGEMEPHHAMGHGDDYVEAQYHGGVRTGDIDHLEFTHRPSGREMHGAEDSTQEALANYRHTAEVLGKPHRVLQRETYVQEPLETPGPSGTKSGFWTHYARSGTGLGPKPEYAPRVISHDQFREIHRSPYFRSEWGVA